MDVLGDLVGRERRSDDIALRRASRAGSYSYEKLCTSAWKAGNLLRHYGVRSGAEVAIAVSEGNPTPPVVTGFFGAPLLGAPVRFVHGGDVDAKALLVPVERVAEFDPAPGCTVLAHGGDPESATLVHFEREVWSENPTAPPDSVDPDAVAVLILPDGSPSRDSGGRTRDSLEKVTSGSMSDESYTHADLLGWATDVADDRGLTAASVRAVDGSLADPTVLVECLLAPLSVGATVVLESEVAET
jgi:hypothetical protein